MSDNTTMENLPATKERFSGRRERSGDRERAGSVLSSSTFSAAGAGAMAGRGLGGPTSPDKSGMDRTHAPLEHTPSGKDAVSKEDGGFRRLEFCHRANGVMEFFLYVLCLESRSSVAVRGMPTKVSRL